ncbi:MAG: hypothetical protein GY925_09645, partial [Actinomycetia bacterium]|nr:hypothetical protein [Actinomycetes bacterium]
MSPTTSSRRIAAFALSLTVLAAACSDDGNENANDSDTGLEVTDEPVDTAPGQEPITVIGVDFGFDGLPEQIKAGTEMTFTNASHTEVHELVLIRVNDDENRPLGEILSLPPEEQQSVGTTVGVNVAFPDDDGRTVMGDLRFSKPGRYILLCAIPEGADPDEYASAAAESQGGPVQVDGGPPHFVLGMVA